MRRNLEEYKSIINELRDAGCGDELIAAIINAESQDRIAKAIENAAGSIDCVSTSLDHISDSIETSAPGTVDLSEGLDKIARAILSAGQ